MTKEQAQALVQSLAFDRADISDLLDASAGTDASAETVYRPYAVAAYLWITSKNTQRLHEARGAVFDDPRSTIDGLLGMQVPWDAGLTIADEWTVEALRRAAGGGQARVVF